MTFTFCFNDSHKPAKVTTEEDKIKQRSFGCHFLCKLSFGSLNTMIYKLALTSESLELGISLFLSFYRECFQISENRTNCRERPYNHHLESIN